MEREAFMDILAAEGFEETVTVTREPGGFLGLHAHPFEAKALILRGELVLNVQGAEQCYRAGQVFHLAAGTPHLEQYGPRGVEYLVGRR
ncbi:MAG: cupin domain-containing protein [Polaromonas sp.]|nr:cupin domain-containing protein [Polaromonas sp.]